MALSWYFSGFLVCAALTAIQGCSTDGSVCLFVHRGALFQASANGVKTIGPVGRDAFLDPAGSLSWTVVCPKTEGDDGSGTSVEVHRLDSKGRLALLRRFDFPKGHYIRTTAMAGGILFVTGELGGCTLGLYDTRSPNPVFSPVELPEQVKRKAFDDLIIDGKSLLAVDNVIMPKWLVRYDISDPAKPKPTEVTELMAGFNEHVVRGVVGTKYLVLFSQSMWDGGNRRMCRYTTNRRRSRHKRKYAFGLSQIGVRAAAIAAAIVQTPRCLLREIYSSSQAMEKVLACWIAPRTMPRMLCPDDSSGKMRMERMSLCWTLSDCLPVKESPFGCIKGRLLSSLKPTC